MSTTRTAVGGVAALVLAATLAGCGNSATTDTASTTAAVPTQSSPSESSAHNKADMMFARMMIPHHEQAIEMSEIILAKTLIDPRVVDLARQIAAAQGPEIEKMQGWLEDWGMADMPDMSDMPGHGGDMPGHGGMDGSGMAGVPGMAGLMSEAQMQALNDAEGVEASKLFLTGMIAHHEGALTMARDEIDNGEFPDAVALARSILDSQQKEIDTMNEILRSL